MPSRLPAVGDGRCASSQEPRWYWSPSPARPVWRWADRRCGRVLAPTCPTPHPCGPCRRHRSRRPTNRRWPATAPARPKAARPPTTTPRRTTSTRQRRHRRQPATANAARAPVAAARPAATAGAAVAVAAARRDTAEKRKPGSDVVHSRPIVKRGPTTNRDRFEMGRGSPGRAGFRPAAKSCVQVSSPGVTALPGPRRPLGGCCRRSRLRRATGARSRGTTPRGCPRGTRRRRGRTPSTASGRGRWCSSGAGP